MRRSITIIGIGVIVGALVAAGYHAQNNQTESQRITNAVFDPAVQSQAASTGDAWVTGTADAEPMADVASLPASAAEGHAQGVTDEPAASATAALPEPASATSSAGPMGPDDVTALVRSARALLDAGDHNTAETRALGATRANPRSSAAWHVLGRAQLAHNAAVEAEASFRRACELDPENAYAANNLGYVRLLRGEWKAAREPLETAVSLRDDVAYFHNNLGVVYERLGLWELAAAAYGRAVELDPDHSRARVSLARAQSHLGPDARQLARSDTDSMEVPTRFVAP